MATDKFAAYSKEGIYASIDSFYEQDEELTEHQKALAAKLRAPNIQVMYRLASDLSVERVETSKNKSVNKYLTKKKIRSNLDGE